MRDGGLGQGNSDPGVGWSGGINTKAVIGSLCEPGPISGRLSIRLILTFIRKMLQRTDWLIVPSHAPLYDHITDQLQ